MAAINIKVNGVDRSIDPRDADMPLLYALRNDLGLKGAKFGCGLGQCGACTVHVDGQPVRSCMTPVSSLSGRAVTTIEGLGSPEAPHAVQAAFMEEQAAQCGYCTNGMVMTSAALLKSNPRPSETEIRDALAGNLCRCGSHDRVIGAVLRASGRARG